MTTPERVYNKIQIASKQTLRLFKAVRPIVDMDTWKCGYCKWPLEHQNLLADNVLYHEHYDYCPHCGRKVNWDA